MDDLPDTQRWQRRMAEIMTARQLHETRRGIRRQMVGAALSSDSAARHGLESALLIIEAEMARRGMEVIG